MLQQPKDEIICVPEINFQQQIKNELYHLSESGFVSGDSPRSTTFSEISFNPQPKISLHKLLQQLFASDKGKLPTKFLDFIYDISYNFIEGETDDNEKLNLPVDLDLMVAKIFPKSLPNATKNLILQILIFLPAKRKIFLKKLLKILPKSLKFQPNASNVTDFSRLLTDQEDFSFHVCQHEKLFFEAECRDLISEDSAYLTEESGSKSNFDSPRVEKFEILDDKKNVDFLDSFFSESDQRIQPKTPPKEKLTDKLEKNFQPAVMPDISLLKPLRFKDFQPEIPFASTLPKNKSKRILSWDNVCTSQNNLRKFAPLSESNLKNYEKSWKKHLKTSLALNFEVSKPEYLPKNDHTAQVEIDQTQPENFYPTKNCPEAIGVKNAAGLEISDRDVEILNNRTFMAKAKLRKIHEIKLKFVKLPLKSFLSALKFLLFGIESSIFPNCRLNSQEDYFIEGYSSGAIKTFCCQMIKISENFKFLENLVQEEVLKTGNAGAIGDDVSTLGENFYTTNENSAFLTSLKSKILDQYQMNVIKIFEAFESELETNQLFKHSQVKSIFKLQHEIVKTSRPLIKISKILQKSEIFLKDRESSSGENLITFITKIKMQDRVTREILENFVKGTFARGIFGPKRGVTGNSMGLGVVKTG